MSKFFISCAARSGSTMLVHLLRSNPQILMHGEVLLKDRIGPLQGKWKNVISGNGPEAQRLAEMKSNNPMDFLQKIIFDSQDRNAVGFKFKTDESLNNYWEPYLDALVRNPDIQVIFLRRNDLIQQYISYLTVTRFGMPTLLRIGDDGDKFNTLNPFALDIKDLEKFCENVMQRELISRKLFRNHASFEITYEEILKDSFSTLTKLQTFLNVIPQTLAFGTVKNLKNINDLILNLEEAYSWIEQTPYSNFNW